MKPLSSLLEQSQFNREPASIPLPLQTPKTYGPESAPITRAVPNGQSPAPQTSRIFWGTLGAILAAAAILVIGYAVLTSKPGETDADRLVKEILAPTPAPTPSPRNTAVDAIDGYKSIKIGVTYEKLQNRGLSLHSSWHQADEVPIAAESPEDYSPYRVTNVLPEEREWGGVKVSAIDIHFRCGCVTNITIRFESSEDFLSLEEGFTRKYGPPTESLPRRWEGNDTIVSMNYQPGFENYYVDIERKSVTERIEALKKQEEDELTEQAKRESERRAAEVKKKLDAEP